MSAIDKGPTSPIGDYSGFLTCVLGSGSYGKVYEAMHNDSKQICAAKEIIFMKQMLWIQNFNNERNENSE